MLPHCRNSGVLALWAHSRLRIAASMLCGHAPLSCNHARRGQQSRWSHVRIGLLPCWQPVLPGARTGRGGIWRHGCRTRPRAAARNTVAQTRRTGSDNAFKYLISLGGSGRLQHLLLAAPSTALHNCQESGQSTAICIALRLIKSFDGTAIAGAAVRLATATAVAALRPPVATPRRPVGQRRCLNKSTLHLVLAASQPSAPCTAWREGWTARRSVVARGGRSFVTGSSQVAAELGFGTGACAYPCWASLKRERERLYERCPCGSPRCRIGC